MLAKSFERHCREVLQSALPGAEVRVFGTAKGSGEFDGKNFKERLDQLAVHLDARVSADAEDISDSENGDRGLDVVAAVNVGDGRPGHLIVFAQAATGREWTTKQHSVTERAWDGLLHLKTPAVPACLIPYCYRRIGGAWHDATKVHRTWALDRGRMFSLTDRVAQGRERRAWRDSESEKVVEGVLDFVLAD